MSKLQVVIRKQIVWHKFSRHFVEGQVFRITGARSLTTTAFSEFQKNPDLQTHESLYNFSLQNPDEFWGTLARNRLQWYKNFSQVQDCDIKKGHIRWFLGGSLNASVNCVDRHLKELGDKPALIWEKDEPGTEEYVTYRELSKMVNKIGNMFHAHGIKRGDRVAIYLPTSPICVAAMLACARIGAVHSVVFAGFSAEALADRIIDAEASTVITADEGVRGGKVIPLKKVVDDAVSRCPCVKRVFVYERTGNKDVPRGKLDLSIEKEMSSQSDECIPEQMESEDYLFMLYTSGSTGKPKGIAHATAGYLLYALLTQKHVFDYRTGEKFGCVADVGWITGHSYVVYGPLSNGATTVLFESTPIYPDPGRYWEMVERLKLEHIYLAPTSLRMLLKDGDKYVNKYNRSSLRKLGCVGEPLNREAWEWFNNVVGEKRCDLVDTWWQTETGGICIAPRPSEEGAKIIPAMPMRPFFGIQPALLDAGLSSRTSMNEAKELVDNGVKGALCIKSVWPGMARTIWGDHERFLNTYYNPYPGYYFSGDGASRSDQGYYAITGRMDDVLNVSGHRLGTAEIEDVLDDHPEVAETAVVGFPHEIKGEGICAFVVLKTLDNVHSESELEADMKASIKTRITAFAQPDKIVFTPGLPKTRSGKIMRRILRKIAANKPDELGDTSTLFDPSVVDILIEKHQQLNK